VSVTSALSCFIYQSLIGLCQTSPFEVGQSTLGLISIFKRLELKMLMAFYHGTAAAVARSPPQLFYHLFIRSVIGEGRVLQSLKCKVQTRGKKGADMRFLYLV
jgi:hypothetical protein